MTATDSIQWVRKHGSKQVATRREALALVRIAAAEYGYTFTARCTSFGYVVADADL